MALYMLGAPLTAYAADEGCTETPGFFDDFAEAAAATDDVVLCSKVDLLGAVGLICKNKKK